MEMMGNCSIDGITRIDASLIIKQHNDFFESLGNIECVEVLGHSLSDVDIVSVAACTQSSRIRCSME